MSVGTNIEVRPAPESRPDTTIFEVTGIEAHPVLLSATQIRSMFEQAYDIDLTHLFSTIALAEAALAEAVEQNKQLIKQRDDALATARRAVDSFGDYVATMTGLFPKEVKPLSTR